LDGKRPVEGVKAGCLHRVAAVVDEPGLFVHAVQCSKEKTARSRRGGVVRCGHRPQPSFVEDPVTAKGALTNYQSLRTLDR
jgi:hypothetical protein